MRARLAALAMLALGCGRLGFGPGDDARDASDDATDDASDALDGASDDAPNDASDDTSRDDAAGDAGEDGASDTSVDATSDTSVDATSDATTDATSDAIMDSGEDAAPDANDGALDAGTDTAAPDAGPVREPPTLVATIAGTYDASEVAFAHDAVRDVTYIGLRDALYRYEPATRTLARLSDTNAAGDDRPASLTVDEARGSIYFVATIDGSARKLFRAHFDATVEVVATDALTDIYPGGDDAPRDLTLDPGRDALYFVANSVTIPGVVPDPTDAHVYRASSSTDASLPLNRDDALTATARVSGDRPEIRALDRTRGFLYFVSNVPNDFDFADGIAFRLFRLTAATTAASPIVATDRLTQTKVDFPNDYPRLIAFDEGRDALYFSALSGSTGPDFTARMYRAGSSVTSADPITVADPLAIFGALGTAEECAFLAKLESDDAVFVHCFGDDVEGVFRLSSATSPAAPLDASDALTSRIPAPGVRPAEDEARGVVYVSLDDFIDVRLHALTATGVTPLPETCAACDDLPHDITLDPATGRVLFTAMRATDRRELYLLDSRTGLRGPLSSVQPSGDDEPVSLLLDEGRHFLYFTAQPSPGLHRLYGLDLDGPLTPVETSMSTLEGSGETLAALWIRPGTGEIFVRGPADHGTLRLYVFE